MSFGCCGVPAARADGAVAAAAVVAAATENVLPPLALPWLHSPLSLPEIVVQLRVPVLEIPGGQDLTKEQFFMEEQNFKKIEIVDFLELTS